MSLLFPHAEGAANSSKQSKIWIGDGPPAIPKRLHDRMINWEFVDLVELKPAGVLESLHPEPDPQRYIILPGLEVARARKKPIEEIRWWIQCFAIYMALIDGEEVSGGHSGDAGIHAEHHEGSAGI